MLSNKLLKKFTIDHVLVTAPIEPRCPHAAECGGCAFQDRAYAAQLAVKAAALAEMWAAGLPGVVTGPISIIPSPDPFNYRTRMDYVTSRDRMGLRRSGKFNWVVDLHECHLLPPADFAVARAAYERVVELGLPGYDLRSHQGFTRYLVVRRSPQGTLLLALTTASSAYAAEMDQLAAYALTLPGVASFHWLLNEGLSDSSFGESLRYWGSERLAMQVGARTLEIGPNTFFQNNVHLLLPLLDDVLARVTEGRSPARRVADLYGGVGTIALHIADYVGRVVCIEEYAESAALARHNIAQNQVENAEAVTSDTLAYVKAQPTEAFEIIIADPPRAGLGPEVSRELLYLKPERIIYVSCNPLTQVEDAKILLQGYDLTTLRGYDMFPHTPHMESLAVFDRKS